MCVCLCVRVPLDRQQPVPGEFLQLFPGFPGGLKMYVRITRPLKGPSIARIHPLGQSRTFLKYQYLFLVLFRET